MTKGLVVFDLETTGVDPEVDRIVQLAAIKFPDPLNDEDENESLVLRVNPMHPISKEATKVHGFTNEGLKDAPTFKDVSKQVMDFFGDCDLGGHNIIAFDVPLLKKEFGRVGHSFSIEGRRLIDSLEIFRHVLPHTLEAALRFFTGKDLEGAHDAECDTKAASEVIFGELKEYDLSLDEAHKISMGDRITLDGKIVKGEFGPVLNFGKQKGRHLSELAKYDRGFLDWMLKKDFSMETKNVVLRALNGDFPLPSEGN